ncbi:hypothetical protein AB0H17_11330 [Streptomyces olivoreticuli]
MRRTPRGVAMAAVLALSPVAGCSGGGGGSASSPSPAAATPAVTRAQADSALITETDLEGNWTRTSNAHGPGDELFRGKANTPQCQRFLDDLASGNLLGEKPQDQADRRFTGGSNAYLHYRVAGYAPGDAEKGIARLKTLPQACDQFDVAYSGGVKGSGQVVTSKLPGVGEGDVGLQLTLKTTLKGLPATLTLDTAAVRVGPNALTLTNGGLGGAVHPVTEQAVKQGTQQLKDVLKKHST